MSFVEDVDIDEEMEIINDRINLIIYKKALAELTLARCSTNWGEGLE